MGNGLLGVQKEQCRRLSESTAAAEGGMSAFCRLIAADLAADLPRVSALIASELKL
jgi:hypothetical protein